MFTGRRLDLDRLLNQARVRLQFGAVEASRPAKSARQIVVLTWFMLISFLRSQLVHARLETLAEVITSTLIPALTLACVSLRLHEARLHAPIHALADMRARLRSRPVVLRLMEYAAQLHFVYSTLAAHATSAISPLLNTPDRWMWALAALLQELLPAPSTAQLAFVPQFVVLGDGARHRHIFSCDLFNLLC
jgi:hypothetical protein